MGDMADDDEALFSDRFSTRIKNRFPQRMRFRQILMQNKVWAYWDQDARAFREIKIRKMRRKHARNAAAWLVKNQKDVTEIMLGEGGSILVKMLAGAFETHPAQMVQNMPVYHALVKRGTKPVRKPKPPVLTLAEWAMIAGEFREDGGGSPAGHALAVKIDTYLRSFHECS